MKIAQIVPCYAPLHLVIGVPKPSNMGNEEAATNTRRFRSYVAKYKTIVYYIFKTYFLFINQ